MGETAGGCGIVTRSVLTGKFSPFCDRTKQIARNEIRKNELTQKGKTEGLSTSEKLELLSYKANNVLDWFNNAGKGSVCYDS